MKAKDDLVGRQFGRLVAIERVGKNRNRQAVWRCICGCGTECLIARCYLVTGHTSSCGCKWKEKIASGNPKHSQYGTPSYTTWGNMIARCHDNNNPAYRNYGGRGIHVCRRWRTFSNFFEDMGPRPEGCSIERKDNSKGYSKENCVWATRREQNRNTRQNVFYTISGIKKCLADWAESTGVNYGTLRSRLGRGLSIEEALR